MEPSVSANDVARLLSGDYQICPLCGVVRKIASQKGNLRWNELPSTKDGPRCWRCMGTRLVMFKGHALRYRFMQKTTLPAGLELYLPKTNDTPNRKLYPTCLPGKIDEYRTAARAYARHMADSHNYEVKVVSYP